MTRYALHALAAFLLLTGAGCANRATSVTDKAGLFSAEARREANAQIKALKDEYNVNLVTETFADLWRLTLPDLNALKKVAALDAAGRNAYFKELAAKRAKAKGGPRSVYVLVCTEPAPVNTQVVVGPKAGEWFSRADAEELDQRLQTRLKAKQNDVALRDAVDFVRTTLDDSPLAGSRAAAFDWGFVLWPAFLAVAAWALVEFLRTVRGVPRGAFAGPGPPAYGGGGSYMAGLFATLTRCEYKHLLYRGGPDLLKQLPCADPTDAVAHTPADDLYRLDHYPADDHGPAPHHDPVAPGGTHGEP